MDLLEFVDNTTKNDKCRLGSTEEFLGCGREPALRLCGSKDFAYDDSRSSFASTTTLFLPAFFAA